MQEILSNQDTSTTTFIKKFASKKFINLSHIFLVIVNLNHFIIIFTDIFIDVDNADNIFNVFIFEGKW